MTWYGKRCQNLLHPTQHCCTVLRLFKDARLFSLLSACGALCSCQTTYAVDCLRCVVFVQSKVSSNANWQMLSSGSLLRNLREDRELG